MQATKRFNRLMEVDYETRAEYEVAVVEMIDGHYDPADGPISQRAITAVMDSNIYEGDYDRIVEFATKKLKERGFSITVEVDEKSAAARAELSQRGISYMPRDLLDAVTSGDLEVVKLFVEADRSQGDRLQGDGLVDTADAFVRAVSKGDLEAVKLFVEAGMSLETVDKYGRTVLMVSAWRGRGAVMSYLIRQGADVKATVRDGGGDFVLMDAARSGDWRAVLSILEQGMHMSREKLVAEIDAGVTARMLAAAAGRKELARYLEDLENRASRLSRSRAGAASG